MTNGLRIGFAIVLLVFAVSDTAAVYLLVASGTSTPLTPFLLTSRVTEAVGLYVISFWLLFYARYVSRENRATV